MQTVLTTLLVGGVALLAAVVAVGAHLAKRTRARVARSRRDARMHERLRSAGPGPWREAARMLRLAFREVDGTSHEYELTGDIAGNRVVVNSGCHQSEGKRRYFTRFRVLYPRLLRLGLRLTREGVLSGVERHLGGQDIEVGDAPFDKDVVVKSKDVTAVREFLTAARRLRIHRLLMSYKGLVIGDSGLSWTTRGVVRETEKIVTIIRRMVHVASHMWEEREEDQHIDRALEARRRGRIREAVEIVRSIPATSDAAEKPIEHRVMEGELLLLGGRKEEASKIFQKARDEAPDDLEIQDLAERAALSADEETLPPSRPPPLASAQSSQPPPLPSSCPPPLPSSCPPPLPPSERSRAAPAVVETPEIPALPEVPAASASEIASPSVPSVSPSVPPVSPSAPPVAREADAVEDLDVREMCETLFDANCLSVDTTRIFEAQYRSRRVRLSGRLTSVDAYPFDFVFGDEPGTKATLELHEVEDALYGSKTVTAILQLPRDAHDDLTSRLGETVAFEGSLHSVDGFVQNIYVTQGQLQSELTA